MNAASFAGHADWRIATTAGCCGYSTGEAAELESIVDPGAPGCGGGGPCIDSVFGPTVAGIYRSASTVSFDLDGAWVVDFLTGVVFGNDKANGIWVRAVRPGS